MATSQGITIRRYRESDAKALWNIFFHTIRSVNIRDYSQQQVEAWAPDYFDDRLWQQKMREIKPFVAELNGQIVGYADLQRDGLIDHFYCHRAFQSKGIGRALMEHVLSVADRKGIQRLYSHVSITARTFYQHFGFILVKEQQVEVSGQWLKNFVMQRISEQRPSVIHLGSGLSE